jgi:hypothetical protein
VTYRREAPEPPAEGLPAGLVHQLITRVGLTEDGIAAMTRQQAVERLAGFWTEGG